MSKKNFLGKYSHLRGTTIKREVPAVAPAKGIVGKAGGKTCNYPLDSQEEFEKRLKLRYKRMQADAETKTAEAPAPQPVENADVSAAVPA